MRAISVFSFEAGTSSFWWRARMELRMRVTKSATGSVKLILSPPLCYLPAGLHDARDLSPKRQLAEAQTAQTELAQVRAGPAADLAAIVLAAGKLRFAGVFNSFCCC